MTLHDIIKNRMTAFQQIGCPALLETFVIRNGIVFNDVCPKAKWPKGAQQGQLKACFENSTNAHWRAGLRYVEGIAMNNELQFPVLHAWNLDEQWRVVDTTWPDPSNCQYVGVVIPDRTLRQTICKNGFYGVLDSGVGMNVDLMLQMDADLPKAVPQLNDYLNRKKEK